MPQGSFIAGDEKLLAGALASATLSTLSWLDGVKDARIAITAALEPVGHVTFTVSQETVAPPEVWLRRAFDHQWVDRPGGIARGDLDARGSNGGGGARRNRHRRRRTRHPDLDPVPTGI